MRQRSIAGATVLLSAVCVSPAAADPVPLAEALDAVSRSCLTTRDALLAVGGTVVSGESSVVLAGDRFEVRRPGTNRIVLAATGTYGALADAGLSRKDRTKALGYLRRPAATWWFRGGYESPGQAWAATFEQSRDAAVGIDGACSQSLTGAADPTDRTAGTWTFTIPEQEVVTASVDGEGRLVSLRDTRITFGAQPVSAPAGAVPFPVWEKASQAASLNATLREVTREVAGEVNAAAPSLTALETAVLAAVPADRVVRIKVRRLRQGILVSGRNPYTGTYHAWRVYLKAGKAIARRVAP